MDTKKIIIAIDGYSSCGKSAVAKDIAKVLDLTYIDTGAMYRAVTLYAIRKGIISNDIIDTKKLEEELQNIDIQLLKNEETSMIETFMNGENVEREIRSLNVSNHVSAISSLGFVRKRLVELQREMGNKGSVVLDGRDIATVVFPNADYKIFMTASPEVRAKRRFDEMTEKREQVTYEEILENVKNRDMIDSSRTESPLKMAEDAVMLDNTEMTKQEQLQWVLNKIGLVTKRISVVVDSESGFCFGVSRAVRMAEEQLNKNEKLISIGDIVHNSEEVSRLEKKGLRTISHDDIAELKNGKVLLRAHGEPPSTYMALHNEGIKIIDATCPVVLKLQYNVRHAWKKMKEKNGQIVIYGKKGHPEVAALIGQTNGEAVVISGSEDLMLLDTSRPIEIFSQTTMSNKGLIEIEQIISEKFDKDNFIVHHTICDQVEKRAPHLENFAKNFDTVIFVGGEKSSNGKMLYDVCKQVNPFTYYAYSDSAIKEEWFNNKPQSVGICGATSTPQWLMERVAEKVDKIVNN